MEFIKKLLGTSTRQQGGIINHFKSLEFLPMFNYYKVEELGDLRYLLKLGDYEDLPETNTDHLVELWNDLQLDVQEENIRLHRKSQIIADKAQQIRVKTGTYKLIQDLISFLWMVDDPEHRATLETLGYKINDKKDYHEELNRIKKRSQIKITEIGILQDELKHLTEVTGGGSKHNLASEIEFVEAVLYEGRASIDMNTLQMNRWLIKKFKAIKANESRKK